MREYISVKTMTGNVVKSVENIIIYNANTYEKLFEANEAWLKLNETIQITLADEKIVGYSFK